MTLVLKDTGPLSEACLEQEQDSDALRQRMASRLDTTNSRVQLPIRDVNERVDLQSEATKHC